MLRNLLLEAKTMSEQEQISLCPKLILANYQEVKYN